MRENRETTQIQDRVFGRADELATIEAFLGEVPAGPAAMLVAGKAGIGKTTLWRETIWSAEAKGYRVLRSAAASPPFGGTRWCDAG